jgi:hypothetical protein
MGAEQSHCATGNSLVRNANGTITFVPATISTPSVQPPQAPSVSGPNCTLNVKLHELHQQELAQLSELQQHTLREIQNCYLQAVEGFKNLRGSSIDHIEALHARLNQLDEKLHGFTTVNPFRTAIESLTSHLGGLSATQNCELMNLKTAHNEAYELLRRSLGEELQNMTKYLTQQFKDLQSGKISSTDYTVRFSKLEEQLKQLSQANYLDEFKEQQDIMLKNLNRIHQEFSKQATQSSNYHHSYLSILIQTRRIIGDYVARLESREQERVKQLNKLLESQGEMISGMLDVQTLTIQEQLSGLDLKQRDQLNDLSKALGELGNRFNVMEHNLQTADSVTKQEYRQHLEPLKNNLELILSQLVEIKEAQASGNLEHTAHYAEIKAAQEARRLENYAQEDQNRSLTFMLSQVNRNLGDLTRQVGQIKDLEQRIIGFEERLERTGQSLITNQAQIQRDTQEALNQINSLSESRSLAPQALQSPQEQSDTKTPPNLGTGAETKMPPILGAQLPTQFNNGLSVPVISCRKALLISQCYSFGSLKEQLICKGYSDIVELIQPTTEQVRCALAWINNSAPNTQYMTSVDEPKVQNSVYFHYVGQRTAEYAIITEDGGISADEMANSFKHVFAGFGVYDTDGNEIIGGWTITDRGFIQNSEFAGQENRSTFMLISPQPSFNYIVGGLTMRLLEVSHLFMTRAALFGMLIDSEYAVFMTLNRCTVFEGNVL